MGFLNSFSVMGGGGLAILGALLQGTDLQSVLSPEIAVVVMAIGGLIIAVARFRDSAGKSITSGQRSDLN